MSRPVLRAMALLMPLLLPTANGFQPSLKALLAGSAALERVPEAAPAQDPPPIPFLPRRCLWGPESDGRHSARCQTVYTMALEEAKLDAKNISTFGCNVPKVPWSWVQRIEAMDHTKKYGFNFMGAHAWTVDLPGFARTPQFKNRDWAIEFAKANFTDSDYLKITDIDEEYQPLGAWDYSSTDSVEVRAAHGLTGDDYDEYQRTFDENFFAVMSASNFTLAPGGDMPWSMRFYEAIAARSIPVINKVMFDASADHLWALWEIPYKYYIKDSGDELVYRQDWADYNFDLFVRYQTFQEGDLQPPQ